MIKHVWFDMEGTLTPLTPAFNEAHDELRYRTYAEVTGRPLTPALAADFERLYAKHGSNSEAFTSLGLPSNFWQTRLATLDKSAFFTPGEHIRGTLRELKDKMPISLFTNLSAEEIRKTLALIGVDPKWFTFILSGDDVAARKPALDGFYNIVELSKLPAAEILYIGDRVNVDIIPASKVGMKTCLVWNSSEKADYSCERFEEILKIF